MSENEKWAVLHLDRDDCIYRPFEPESGQWTSPPLDRAGAIARCKGQGLRPGSIMVRLGAALLDLNNIGIKDGTGRWRQSSATRRAKEGTLYALAVNTS